MIFQEIAYLKWKTKDQKRQANTTITTYNFKARLEVSLNCFEYYFKTTKKVGVVLGWACNVILTLILVSENQSEFKSFFFLKYLSHSSVQ